MKKTAHGSTLPGGVALILILALSAAACSTTGATEPDFAALDPADAWTGLSDAINAAIKARHIKGGCAISVADASGELWSGGFGLADPGTGKAFTAATISNVGSVSKLLTATAVMRLVEEGKLDLDAPITAYLPELRPKTRFPETRPITLRDVMTHHSGLPSDWLLGFRSEGTRPEGYPESFLDNARLVSRMYVANPPGRVLSYSNLSIAMLGIVIERASGRPFEAYCQESIFGPLGMKDSSFVLPEGFEDDPRYAKGLDKGRALPQPLIRDIPAGALETTATDLARFTASCLSAYQGGPGILAPSTMKAMFRVQNAGVAADLDDRIGLTFFVTGFDQLPGEAIVGHDGALPPFFALVLLLPERGLAVSLLVNSGEFRLLEDLALPALRAAVLATGAKPFAAPDKVEVGAVAPIQAPIAGNYASRLGLVKVRQKGGAFRVNLLGRWFDAVGHEGGLITLEKRILGIRMPIRQLEGLAIHVLDFEGRVALGLGSPGNRGAIAVPVEASPIPPAWKARFGTYAGRDTGGLGSMLDVAVLGIDQESGLLVVGLGAGRERAYLPLRAVSDNECLIEGLGRNLGETIEAVADGLVYEGLLLRKK